MKNILLLITVIIIIGAGFMYYQSTKITSVPSVPSSPVVTESIPTPTSTSGVIPTAAGDTNDLKAGGSSFRDPKGVFAFLYPNDYKLDTQGEGQYVRITKIGATQRGQTEIYDGVVMVFEVVNLEGKTLEEWVDNSIKTSTADGTSEVTRPKEKTTLNGYPGFTYTIRGLGESTYLVIQKNPESQNAVVITRLVADPEQVGYEAEVTSILSTIELLQ